MNQSQNLSNQAGQAVGQAQVSSKCIGYFNAILIFVNIFKIIVA